MIGTSRRKFLGLTAGAGLMTAMGGAAPAKQTGKVQTVLGLLDASQLGYTLAHEHIADAPDVLKRWPKEWGGRTEFSARAHWPAENCVARGHVTADDRRTANQSRPWSTKSRANPRGT